MADDKIIKIRHSLAHVMAAAVQEIYPNVKFGIGPVIENGFFYDFDFPKTEEAKDWQITPEIFPEIEKRMRAIIKKGLPVEQLSFPIAHAIKEAKTAGQVYKLELLQEIKSGKRSSPEAETDIEETKKGEVSFYRIGGFTDLCKGPHVKNTKELPLDGFKLARLAGAYWKGDSSKPQMQRIYAIAFESKKELAAYLELQKEIEKRDHRKIGADLDLFAFSDLVGPGLPIWTVKGTIIRDELEKFAKETEAKWGYQRIATPHIAKAKLFETSGHLPYYKDDMYPGMELDDATYYLKGMNCPLTLALFASKPHSYKELPLRWAEYGTVYRYELSGVLSGLLRVRGFTQNDAHIFCAEDQVEDEFIKVMKLHEYYYRDVFGLKDYYIRLSLRDKTKKDKFGGNDALWEKAENMIHSAIKKSGVPFKEAVGEASFYGPKADFQIKSVVGKEETASTNQIDFVMPSRFGLKYTGADGKEHPVVVIHRAPLGSHERFVGFLIEHYAGAFPIWLSPVQAVIVPISDKFLLYAKKIEEKLKAEDIRVELDSRNESVSKKIREAEMQKAPYILVIGEKEEKAKAVAVRKRGKGDMGSQKLEKFLESIKKEIKEKRSS